MYGDLFSYFERASPYTTRPLTKRPRSPGPNLAATAERFIFWLAKVLERKLKLILESVQILIPTHMIQTSKFPTLTKTRPLHTPQGAAQLPSRAAPPAVASRPTNSSIRMPRWMYGYGVFQGSAATGDSLILFFGATVLGLSPALVGMLDAVSSIALSVGAIVLAVFLNRIRQTDKLFVISLGGVGVSLVLFATVGNIGLAMALAVVFGLGMAPAGALAPVLASRQFPQSMWNRSFAYLNQSYSLGGALGIGLGAAWLMFGGLLSNQDLAIRMLFVGIGVTAVVGALQIHSSYKSSNLPKQPSLGNGESKSRRVPRTFGVDSYHGIQLPMLSDQLIFHLVFSWLLFVGAGMSFIGIHMYLIQDLRASVAVAMVAIMGFKLVSYFASPLFSRGFAQLLPVQVLSITGLWRSATLLVMLVLAMLLPPSMVLPSAIIIIALWGVSSSAIMINGVGATAQLALRGRLRESMVFYVAIMYAGAITGAWLGGALAGLLGFEGMFLTAAGLSLLASILLLRN